MTGIHCNYSNMLPIKHKSFNFLKLFCTSSSVGQDLLRSKISGGPLLSAICTAAKSLQNK